MKENEILDEEIDEQEEITDEEFSEEDDSDISLDDEESDDEIDDSEEDEGDIEIADDEDGDTEDSAPPAHDKSTVRDEEKEALRRELNTLKARSGDALKSLGIETDDVADGLAQLAAESDGVSKEEYIKGAEQKQKASEIELAGKLAAYEQMKASDLAAIHAEYPETKKYKSVEEFPNFKRFGELRDGGASPAEAFVASHSKQVQSFVSGAARQKALNDSRDHLRSVVPKASKDTATVMTRGELDTYREMFPDASDKEIRSLYRRAKS